MTMTELPDWEYRERCLRAKGHECSECGAKEDLVVHHIDGNRDNNDLENLVPLCTQCHTLVHAGSDDHAELVRALGKIPKEMGKTTSIQIEEETWRKLNHQKSSGDSFDDVVNELLDGISGDAHDQLLFFKQEDETLADALDRVMSVLPGPGDFDRGGVDRLNLEEENFVFLHLPTEDGEYRTSVYRDPGHLMREQAEVLETDSEL